MKNIDSFDQILNTEKLGHLLLSMKGDKDLTPYRKWNTLDAIVWAVGALKEYGIIGTDEEVMLWPKNMPEDLEIFEHQYLRFKQVDWKKDDVFDWFSAYLIIKSAMYEPKDMTSYAHQVGVKFQVKALLDLIVKQEKQIAYEKIS